MAIQFIGSATGTTSATLPAHQAGDLILAFAFRNNSNTAPTLPSGWTNIRNDGANTCSGRLAYRIATASNTVSGTWTNATRTVFLVYRGVNSSNPIGNNNTNTAVSTTVNYPALTLTASNTVVGVAGHRTTNTTLVAPTGMTNRALVTNLGAHDTNGSVSSWASTNTSVGGSSSGWRSYVVELNTLIINTEKKLDSLEMISAAGFFGLAVSSWYPWFFERLILQTSGSANKPITGISLDAELGNIEIFASVDSFIEIDGIELSVELEPLSANGFAFISLNGILSEAQQENLTANGGGLILADDISANLFVEPISATGAANKNINGINANYEFNFVVTAGAANYEITGQELESVASSLGAFGFGFVSIQEATVTATAEAIVATGAAFNEIAGIEAQIELGEVSARAVIVNDATIEVKGLELKTQITAPIARAISDQIVRASGVSRRPSLQIQNASFNLQGIRAKIEAGKLNATGTVVISAIAQLTSTEMLIEAQNIEPQGILWISDEELVFFLMAA